MTARHEFEAKHPGFESWERATRVPARQIAGHAEGDKKRRGCKSLPVAFNMGNVAPVHIRLVLCTPEILLMIWIWKRTRE